MEHTGLLAGDPAGRRLTSQEVRQTVFPQAGFARGLNSEQVTRFMNRVVTELDQLTVELVQLAAERGELEAEVNRLSAEAEAQPNGSRGLPPVEQQSVFVLRRAQESADRLVADAQQQARDLVTNGRHQRERMVADGHAQREHVIRQAVDEAGREAGRIAAQAPIDAQRQLAQYRGLAESVRAGLTANLRALAAQVQAWEEQERQGPPPPLPHRKPTGPQTAVPLT